MRIVCVSDTHGRHDRIQVPDGDVLLHAGDLTVHGEAGQIEAADEWLGSLPHRDKVVIAGNHDFLFQEDPARARRLLSHAHYLEDSGLTIGGLSFWGSPWQPWFFDWAFNLRRGAPIAEKWRLIPGATDVLVTHGPPHGILDRVDGAAARVVSIAMAQGTHVGCEELRKVVQRLRPRLHVFGHIHEGYGQEEHGGTRFVNASTCDRGYRPVNPPIVVDL